MSDTTPASWIEFDPPLSQLEPMDVEESYQHYYSLRQSGNVDGAIEFVANMEHPNLFLDGYRQWDAEHHPKQDVPEEKSLLIANFAEQPDNPRLPPQGNGDVLMHYHNFPVLDEAGNQKKDAQGNPIFTDGMGNTIITDERSQPLGDASALFNLEKRQGGRDYR